MPLFDCRIGIKDGNWIYDPIVGDKDLFLGIRKYIQKNLNKWKQDKFTNNSNFKD